MLIDLDLKKKRAAVVGGGREAELKATKLLDSGAAVTVVAEWFTVGLRRLSYSGALTLVKKNPSLAGPLLERLEPVVLFISTGKPALDAELATLGRSIGSLVCVVDTPSLNDFNMPGLARIGPLRVALSSGGQSPAMVKILRKRIEKTIRPEDLLQVELQSLVREHLAEWLRTPAARKKVVYEIINDRQVVRLLKNSDLAGAETRARRIILDRARHRKAEGGR